MKETIVEQEIRSQHQARYFQQLMFASFVNIDERHHYPAKDSAGNETWKELTLQEKKKLKAYAIFARRNNYLEYGGHRENADAIINTAKEHQLEPGKAVIIRIP